MLGPRWPLRNSMPSHSPYDSSGSPVGLLRRHKMLPHPRLDEHKDETCPTPPSSSSHPPASDNPTFQNSSPSVRKLKHRTHRTKADLPPTPPTQSRPTSSGDVLTAIGAFETRRDVDDLTPQMQSPRTPPNQYSPPTPDVTPPALRSHRIMALRPVKIDRDMSLTSVADSFRTAQEFQLSDEDEMSTVRPDLPSARNSEKDVRHSHVARRKLDEDEEEDSDRGITPNSMFYQKPSSESRDDPVSDPEECSASQGALSEEWDWNLMRNVIVRRRPLTQNRISYIYDDTPLDNEVAKDIVVAPSTATRILSDFSGQIAAITSSKLANKASERSASAEMELVNMSQVGLPSSPDYQRLSTMTGKSLVVEVMIVESAPRPIRVLRHARKVSELRDLTSSSSSLQTPPESPVEGTPEYHRRLVHSKKVCDLRHRSLSSSNSDSTSSSTRIHREAHDAGNMSTTVFPRDVFDTPSARLPSPRRTSSPLRRSVDHPLLETPKQNMDLLGTSRPTKRSVSGPVSTSSTSQTSSINNMAPKRLRRMSQADSCRSPRTIDFPPEVPVRSSSLSATTSRDASRAGSLTRESLEAHNSDQIVKDYSQHQDRTAFSVHTDSPVSPRIQLRGSLSPQPTPFSQNSFVTSFTAAELSEARVVSMSSHQNRSVLMVQHLPGSNSSSEVTVQGRSPAVSETEFILKGTTGQTFLIDSDSPTIRNSRIPVEPPIFALIPATPSVLTPATEADRQLGYGLAKSEDKPKLSFSLRRAFSNQRGNSESLISRSFSLKRTPQDQVSTGTQTSRGVANLEPLFPSVADQPTDGAKLHPFWRPTRFWDDLEDFYSDDDDGQSHDLWRAYSRTDKRPIPHRGFSFRRTFAILPIEDNRRFNRQTERRVVRRSQSGRLNVVRRQGSAESLASRRKYSAFSSNHDRRSANLVETWKNLSRRMSERKRERRAQRLKGAIGVPRIIDHSEVIQVS